MAARKWREIRTPVSYICSLQNNPAPDDGKKRKYQLAANLLETQNGPAGEGEEGEGDPLAAAHQGPQGAAEGPVPGDLISFLHYIFKFPVLLAYQMGWPVLYYMYII